MLLSRVKPNPSCSQLTWPRVSGTCEAGLNFRFTNVQRKILSNLKHLLRSSNILRSLATLEADVTSHAEAVLRGRLSRRHLETICIEQSRFQVTLRIKEEVAAGGKGKKSGGRRVDKVSIGGGSGGGGADGSGGKAAEAELDKENKRGLWRSVRELRHVMR